MEKATMVMLVIVALAVVAAVVTVIARLELDMLYTLVVMVVLGVVAALILVAVSLVVRARQPQQPEQRTVIKETRHTHTIDGRKDPKVHVLPGGGGSGGWQVFPDILRGAFLAGGGDQRRLGPGDEEPGDVVEGEWEEWLGPIGATTQNDGRGRW